jgi:hypothetical protein
MEVGIGSISSGTEKKDISVSNPEDFAHRDLDTEEKHSHGESHV